MGLFDFVGDLVEKVGDAVGTAVTWIGDGLRELGEIITDTWQGIVGSPIPAGGTNWNAYSHEELHAMLHTDANPGQVGDQSVTVDAWHRTARDCADELGTQRRDVAGFWTGDAATAFTAHLGRHHQGGTVLSDYASTVSRAIADASDALSRAQHAMPTPVSTDSAIEVGGTLGRAVGAVGGGAPGAALGSALGAATSWFGMTLFAANKKAEAVEVMQQFETALRDAAPPPLPPREQRPPDPLPDPSSIPVLSGSITATFATWHTAAGMAPGSSGTVNPGTTPGATAPTPAPSTAHRPPSTPGSPTAVVPTARIPPASTTTSATSATSATTPLTGSSTGPIGTWPTGPDGRPSGPAIPWRDLVGRGSAPGLLLGNLTGAGATGAHRSTTLTNARGGRSSLGFPGTAAAAPATSTRRDDDQAHRRRRPHHEQLFASDERSHPPVLGA